MCKIKEPHKEEAKARYGLERHIRRRRRGGGGGSMGPKSILDATEKRKISVLA
jgi:hypothetical protein